MITPTTNESSLIDVVGFGSLNLDEFWEVPGTFLRDRGLRTGAEYVGDLEWFQAVYPALVGQGSLRAVEPGGSTANCIAAFALMGFRTGFYGSAGRDGSDALRLQELGRPEHLRIGLTEQPSGRCLALLDRGHPQDEDRALVIFPNANDLAGGADLDVGFFLQSKWVHLTSFVSSGPLQAQMELVERIAGRVRVSFDPGAVYVSKGLAALKPLVARSEVVFASVEELHELCGTDDTSVRGLDAGGSRR